MARRQGLLAEMQHQARMAEKRQQAFLRAQEAAHRRAEQAQKAAERARIAAARASEVERKRLEREAVLAHQAARVAEAEELTAEVQEQYEEIDRILLSTLEVDDFVDLESLRATAQHPPFPREDLRVPIPAPAEIPDPPAPVKREPEPVGGIFGRKKRAAEALNALEREYADEYAAWQAVVQQLPARREALRAAHARAEREREEKLAAELSRYDAECAARDAEAAEQNAALDDLIAGLGYGTVDAVQEYVAIVLANSVYPDWFPVRHEASYEPSTGELALRVVIPGPETIPTIKHYKYTKASDEITPVAATQKDVRDRYTGAVHNIAIRSLHEVFEADRRGLVQAISLELGTEAVNPATGRSGYVPFVAVATTRGQFEELDLSAIVPAATLEHLGAIVSKNPTTLTPIAVTGVRRA